MKIITKKNSNETIEKKRQHMYDIAATKGVSHPDTLKVSQELDRLMMASMAAGSAM